MAETGANASPLPMKGRVAIVTGAARGIGRSGAIALAKEGATVVGLDICGPVSSVAEVKPSSADDLAETGRLVEKVGGGWLAITADQRDIAALEAAAAKVVATFGGIDILFANAGIQSFKPLLSMVDADWHDQIDVNLSGTANAIRAFAPAIVARGGGRIIVTSSTQGQHGTFHGAAYSASKWGLIGLAKSAALELGAHKITVNVLVPGLIDTALTRHEERYAQALESTGKTKTGTVAKDEAAAKSGLAANSPLGVPWIDPDDVAPMLAFLASDAAHMVSGGTFSVTAGDSAHMQS